MAFAAFWTGHASVFFLQRLDVSTFRLAVVIATADELTETAFFVNQLAIAFWTPSSSVAKPARDVFFFFDLFVKVFPEGFHHWLPLALAAGDFVQLVFEFGREVVIHVLAEMLGEEFVDDVAGVGWCEAFLV